MIQFIYSLITFLIAVFFILLGLIGIILPWSMNMRLLATNLIMNYSVMIFLFSFIVLSIGVATATNIIITSRRRYFHFKLHGQTVSIDTTLIENYLQTYWTELFPGTNIPSQVEIKKNKIYITVDLPYVETERQTALLEQIQKELSSLLSNLIGYRHYFHLAASFQPRSDES